MERIRNIYHKGKCINYFDYRGLEDEDAIIQAVKNSTEFLIAQGIPTLQLSNITGVYMTPGVIKPVLAEIEKTKPYVEKDALVGIVGAKRVLFQTYLLIFPGKTKAFVEEADALEWLVSN